MSLACKVRRRWCAATPSCWGLRAKRAELHQGSSYAGRKGSKGEKQKVYAIRHDDENLCAQKQPESICRYQCTQLLRAVLLHLQGWGVELGVGGGECHLIKGLCYHGDLVALVGGLSKALEGGGLHHGLTEGHHRVSHLHLNLSIQLTQILQASKK